MIFVNGAEAGRQLAKVNLDERVLENVIFCDLVPGRQASLTRTLTQEDIQLFAAMSGDVNPAHMDPDYARTDIFHSIVGHGMWTGALISTLLGTVLPGPGTIYLEQNIKFKQPVRIGDTVIVTVVVRDKRADKPIVTFDCNVVNQRGEIVADGLAKVLAPTEKLSLPRAALPQVEIQTHQRFQAIIESCKTMKPLRTALVHPVHAAVLQAAKDAAQAGLIVPVLVGPADRIHAAAKEAGIDLSSWEVIDAEHSHAAPAKAVELAAAGRVAAIMKGSLHSDELLAAVVPSTSGLRTERRISHAYVLDVPAYHKLLIITDAAVNIAPDVTAKADICQNTIGLWRALFGEDRKPKVAILAAVETVNPKMCATVDAAQLCKMADRGQITDGILDGPLALDSAISKQAANDKEIRSSVAGDADILLVPDIEAGNMLAKQLTFLSHADAAGIVLGARVPIILTSRADSLHTRLLSCALAVKLDAARQQGKIK